MRYIFPKCLQKGLKVSINEINGNFIWYLYFLAAPTVGVELILCIEAWLKTRPKPRMILPTNKFQKVCLTVGSGSKLKIN
jgi:hypothetical protein